MVNRRRNGVFEGTLHACLYQEDVRFAEQAHGSPQNLQVEALRVNFQFVAEHGYRLIDITEFNRSPKHNLLWLTKLAFLRNASRLLAHATSYE